METGASAQLERRSSEPPPRRAELGDVTTGIPQFPQHVNNEHVSWEMGCAPLTDDVASPRLDTEAVVYLNEQQCGLIMKTLKTQRESRDLCDVTLLVRDDQFSAHRCVLAANSAYFQSLFKTTDADTLPCNIVVPSSNIKAFESLLDYMYTGQLSISVAIAEELLTLSEKLAIGDVRHCCNIHLEKHVDITNWLLMLALGERFNLEDVVIRAEKCVVENFFVISQGEEVLALSKERLIQFVSKCNPNGDSALEHDILLVIYKWVARHHQERHQYLADLLAIVNKNELDAHKVAEMFQSKPLSTCESVRLPETQKLIQEVATMQANRLLEDLKRKKKEEQEKLKQEDQDKKEKEMAGEGEGKKELEEKKLTEKEGEGEGKKELEEKKLTEKADKKQDVLDASLDAQTDHSQTVTGNAEKNVVRASSETSTHANVGDQEDKKNDETIVEPVGVAEDSSKSDSNSDSPTEAVSKSESSISPINKSDPRKPDASESLPQKKERQNAAAGDSQPVLSAEDMKVASGELSMEDFIAEENGADSDNTEVYSSLKEDQDSGEANQTTNAVTAPTKTGVQCESKGRRRRKPNNPTKIPKKGVLLRTNDIAEAEQSELPIKRRRGRPRKYPLEVAEKLTAKQKIRYIKPKRKRTRTSSTQTKGEVLKSEIVNASLKQEQDIDDAGELAADDLKRESQFADQEGDYAPDGEAEEEMDQNLVEDGDCPWKASATNRRHARSKYAKGSARYVGNQYQCSIEGCKYKTLYRNRMQKHASAHLGIFSQKVVCVICNKEFQHGKHLRRHELIHMDLKHVSCDICNYTSARRDKLKDHIKRMHPQKALELGLLTLEAMERIMEQKRTPKQRKPRRKRHVVHYNEDGTPQQEWACDKCPRKFSTPSALGHHKKGHGSDTPFLCEHCGFSTIHFASINVHKRQHNGKKFVCSHPGCNYSAIRKSRLEDHMNAHQGIKNHVCAICGKAFAGKKHMQRHEKIHQDFKAIACDVCEYRTHRRDKLKEHLRKHHPKEGINIGVLTEADVEREKNSPQKPRKPKKKKAPKERPETEPKKKAKAELAVANPDFVHRVSTASSQYAAPNQSLVVAALQAPPQHMPQLVQQSPLPGTTTISEDMMQYLTSFGGGPQALVQVAPTDPRVAVSVSAEQPHSAVTSPVSTPHLPVPSPSHEQTPGTQLATPVPGEQNLLFYYQIPASAQNYP